MVNDEKACEGGRTIEDGDFVECLSCGRGVRWDLRDDPFWGFQNCRNKEPEVAALRPQGDPNE